MNVESLSSQELEIELLRRAVVRGAELIARQEEALEIARKKQIGRRIELAVQETLAARKGIHP